MNHRKEIRKVLHKQRYNSSSRLHPYINGKVCYYGKKQIQ